MSFNVYLKDDPEINKDQITFDFEFVDENGNLTNTDINLSDPITINSAAWGSLSITNGISAGSIYTVGSSGSWTFAEPGTDPVHERLDKIEGVLRKIQDRLAVIEDIDDIEMKKALRKAYDKYRMVEDMIERKNKE